MLLSPAAMPRAPGVGHTRNASSFLSRCVCRWPAEQPGSQRRTAPPAHRSPPSGSCINGLVFSLELVPDVVGFVKGHQKDNDPLRGDLLAV